jgi:hypothetical protein
MAFVHGTLRKSSFSTRRRVPLSLAAWASSSSPCPQVFGNAGSAYLRNLPGLPAQVTVKSRSVGCPMVEVKVARVQFGKAGLRLANQLQKLFP